MQILEMEFHGWAIGRLRHPEVEILALACLEEENVVAVVELGEFVELVEFCLRVQLDVFAGVGEEGVKVVEEVPVSVE
jgi:hypothetical protein